MLTCHLRGLVLTMRPLAVQGLCSLVERCLNKDADSRPAASELLKDPIFK